MEGLDSLHLGALYRLTDRKVDPDRWRAWLEDELTIEFLKACRREELHLRLQKASADSALNNAKADGIGLAVGLVLGSLNSEGKLIRQTTDKTGGADKEE